MKQQAKTMKLSGNDYAKVAERLRLFREACPNGSIVTDYKFLEDGGIIFTAKVVKDKSDPSSADATGHAMGEKAEKIKIFEKLESVAVGRALANLGYLASGEIASSDEMEEFHEYRQHKIDEAVAQLQDCETLDDLKRVFKGLQSMGAEHAVYEAKEAMKVKLTPKVEAKSEPAN